MQSSKVKAILEAGADCENDHVLLMCQIKVKLIKMTKTKITPKVHLHTLQEDKRTKK